jgi:hypothetical protein
VNVSGKKKLLIGFALQALAATMAILGQKAWIVPAGLTGSLGAVVCIFGLAKMYSLPEQATRRRRKYYY